MANDNNTPPAAADSETTKDQQENNQQQSSPGTGSNQGATGGEQNQQGETPASPARPPVSTHKTDFETDVVYLYQFSRGPLSPSVSPYCLKVEMWLRVAGIKYENVDHKLKFKSKKGQLPFVEVNGQEIGDSDIIIRRLSEQFDRDLDTVLTTEQRNISHAFCVMLDQFTSWAIKWWRFSHPAEFITGTKLNLRNFVNTCLPPAVINFLFKLRSRSKLSSTKAQGIGVHSPQEIQQFAEWDLQALSQFLANKPYFFGDQPSVLDCVAFAHVAQLLCIEDVEFPLKNYVQESCGNLVSFFDRLKAQYWPDWSELTNTLDLNTHLPKPPPAAADDEKTEKETGDDKTRESDVDETEKGAKEEKEKEIDNDGQKKEVEQDENKRVEEGKKEP